MSIKCWFTTARITFTVCSDSHNFYRKREGYGSRGMTVREALDGAFRVQLYAQLFNKVNSWFVEVLKMGAIGACILHGYVGIRFGQNNILIALFYAFIHVVAFVAYCAIFQRAYRLGDMQKQLKQELSAVCGRRTNRSFRNEMLRATAALQCKGMQVGSFHEMERNSALIFIDFVERQLISLLVAF